MLRLEMFLMNVESLMPGVQNLWSEVKLFLLSAETLPVLLISNAVTVVLMCVMSVEKCAYLFVLSMFRCEMFTSRGTVSSKMWNLLFSLSQMVMSGLRLVTMIFWVSFLPILRKTRLPNGRSGLVNPVGARAPPPCAATFPGGKTSSTAAHSLMRHFCFSHRQLSLFAAAFLAITTPPHLEVCDCGAIQQIVRRVRGWSRSRFYSSWHGRQPPFKWTNTTWMPGPGLRTGTCSAFPPLWDLWSFYVEIKQDVSESHLLKSKKIHGLPVVLNSHVFESFLQWKFGKVSGFLLHGSASFAFNFEETKKFFLEQDFREHIPCKNLTQPQLCTIPMVGHPQCRVVPLNLPSIRFYCIIMSYATQRNSEQTTTRNLPAIKSLW